MIQQAVFDYQLFVIKSGSVFANVHRGELYTAVFPASARDRSDSSILSKLVRPPTLRLLAAKLNDAPEAEDDWLLECPDLVDSFSFSRDSFLSNSMRVEDRVTLA